MEDREGRAARHGGDLLRGLFLSEEAVLEEAEAEEDAALATAGETAAESHQELMGALAEFLDRSIHPNQK